MERGDEHLVMSGFGMESPGQVFISLVEVNCRPRKAREGPQFPCSWLSTVPCTTVADEEGHRARATKSQHGEVGVDLSDGEWKPLPKRLQDDVQGQKHVEPTHVLKT